MFRAAPPLGPDFTRLLAASTTTNLGDGMRLAAGPLLVASLTRDPALVGGAVFVQQLPWLLFALPAGAYVDRLDQRRILVAVNAARALVAVGLAALVAAGQASVWAFYVVLFLVGIGEVVADNTSSAMLPALVSSERLPRANARLAASYQVANQLAGPPLGAWLFAAGVALPFAAEAAGFALAAVLLGGLSPARAVPDAPPRQRGWLRADVREGVRWLAGHPVVRLLAIMLATLNVTYMAAFAAWVLYARELLGVSDRGFGLLLSASAAGGLAGAAAGGHLLDRFGGATLLRAALLVETGVHVVLAVTRDPWVAGVTMTVFGAHASIWGVVAVTLRQRLVPAGLLGRVNSVYLFLAMGGSASGALLGGLLAREWGLAAPFWVAAATNLLLVPPVWRQLTPAALAAEPT